MEVLGQPIGPFFKGLDVQEEILDCLTLLHNIPEEHRYHLLGSGILKSTVVGDIFLS